MSEEKGVNSRIIRITLLVLLAVAFVVMAVLFIMDNGALPTVGGAPMHFETTNISIRHDMDSHSQIHTYKDGKGFFLASRDGIRFIGSDGLEKMNSTYNMTAPKLIGKGSTAGVAEAGGLQLYVCSADRLLYTVMTDHPILSFSVAANGYSVVITQNGTEYNIIVYNAQGQINHRGVFVDANVYPMAADVSNDGRILAVSYLDTNGGEMNSKIFFSYINKTEAADFAAAEGVFAADNNHPDGLVGILRFMDGNHLIAVSDRSIVCYEADNRAKRKWDIDLGNTLDAVCFSEPTWFAIAYGDRNPNKPGEEPGLSQFFDLNGTVLGEYQSFGRVSKLAMGYNTALICSGRQFTAAAQNGSVLWTYDATYDVSQALFIENTNRLVLAGGTQTEVLHRVRERSNAAVTEAPNSYHNDTITDAEGE